MGTAGAVSSGLLEAMGDALGDGLLGVSRLKTSGAADVSTVMGDGVMGGSRAIIVEAGGSVGLGEVMRLVGRVEMGRKGTGGSTWSRERDSHSILEASVGRHSLPDMYQPFWKSNVASLLAFPSQPHCTATQLHAHCILIQNP